MPKFTLDGAIIYLTVLLALIMLAWSLLAFFIADIGRLQHLEDQCLKACIAHDAWGVYEDKRCSCIDPSGAK